MSLSLTVDTKLLVFYADIDVNTQPQIYQDSIYAAT